MAKDDMNNVSQDEFATEKVSVISNNLLGSYVDENYVIADDIKEELVRVRKVKKSVYKNSVFCSAFIKEYGDVVFELTFQKNSVKNLAKAELFVLENDYKVNGYIQNTIRTEIGEFVGDMLNFIEKAYAHFHIEITDTGREYKTDEEDFKAAYINAKRLFNVNMAKLTAKDYNKLYKNYVTSRLEVLKKTNNEFSKTVLEKFNSEFAKIEKYFLKENNYKALSELLDKCIEDSTGLNPKLKAQEKEVMENLTPIVQDFTKQADSIFEKAQPKALDNMPRLDTERMEEMEKQLEAEAEKRKQLEEEKRIQLEETKSKVDKAISKMEQAAKEHPNPSAKTVERTPVTPSQHLPKNTKDNQRTQDSKTPNTLELGRLRERTNKDYIKGSASSLIGGKNYNNSVAALEQPNKEGEPTVQIKKYDGTKIQISADLAEKLKNGGAFVGPPVADKDTILNQKSNVVEIKPNIGGQILAQSNDMVMPKEGKYPENKKDEDILIRE